VKETYEAKEKKKIWPDPNVYMLEKSVQNYQKPAKSRPEKRMAIKLMRECAYERNSTEYVNGPSPTLKTFSEMKVF
jgi:hypothetical protein